MQLVFVGGFCRVSVLERVTLGSMLSSHGMARLGSSMSVRAVSRLGDKTSAFDITSTNSLLGVQRFDFSKSITGPAQRLGDRQVR